MKTDFYTNKYFYIVIIVTLLSVKAGEGTWNDASRMATIQSLVEHHTVIIDDSEFINTGDKVFINGHFYSDKPVITSVFGAIAYFPLYYLGINFEGSNNLVYYLIVLIVIKSFWLAGLFGFYKSLDILGAERNTCLVLTVALGFCSLYFTWSAVFNNHLVAASNLALGFYYLLKYRYVKSLGRYTFYAGLFFTLAGCADHATAIFFVGFAIYLFLVRPAAWKHWFYYFIPVVFLAVPNLIFNYLISGQVLPFQLVPSYFEYKGSPWSKPKNLTGDNINNLPFMIQYGFSMLFGGKGFIIYNPILLIGIPCLIMEIVRKRRYYLEAIVAGVCSMIIILFYSAVSRDYSGWSYSIRWFVPLLPFLLIFTFRYLEHVEKPVRKYTFTSLCILSCLIALIGTINPWSSLAHTDIPLYANLLQLTN